MRNLDIRFRVIDKGEIKEISTRNGKELKLAEVEVGDETGRIFLTLWEDSIDELDNGDIAEVRNGYIKVIRDELRLNVGKYGELEKIEDAEDFVAVDDIPNKFNQPPADYVPPYRRRR
ncbi:MAG: hypothetical protein EU542_08295 [Promethearchaeota archaeon]|nr:MAG: hypothetical protein EU542_08295 [Candidatus Lokiarchaeota archaeon]